MPEWLIWAFGIWLVFGVMGRRRCGWGGYGRYRWMTSRGADIDLRDARGRGRRAMPAPRPPETAEQRLQREYVEGRISMAEYEDRLWRELGPDRRPEGEPR